MLDLMSSILMEGDGVTQELLDTILINLIPAHKVCITTVNQFQHYLEDLAISPVLNKCPHLFYYYYFYFFWVLLYG